MTHIGKQARLVLNTFTPQRRKPDPAYAIAESDKDLRGKTVVFTGGTDGMGRVAVEQLYGMGARLVLLGRNEGKSKLVVQELRSMGGSGTVEFQRCDLSSMDSVAACAEQLLEDLEHIHILVNCAGANFPVRRETEDGFEANWAVNFLGPSLLTHLLLERLESSAPARIVNVSSDTEALGHIDFEDLQTEHQFSLLKAYSQAKLALNMLTIELARKLQGTGVTVNSLNPGFIRSNLLRDAEGVQAIFRSAMRFLASPPEVGADRIVRLAISSSYRDATGLYVDEDKVAPPNLEAQDSALRNTLMGVSEATLAPWMTPGR